MNEKAAFADRLREGLAIRDITQADLCRVTGIGKSALSQYTNGKIIPRKERIAAIAHVLDVSEAWLMGYHVSKERNTAATPEEQARLQEAVKVFGKLTPQQQSLMIAQMKGILSMQD